MLARMSETPKKPLTLSDEDIVTSRPKPNPTLGHVGQSPDVVGVGKAGSDPDSAAAPKKPMPSDPDA
jgi:hypothetical protein